MVANIIKNYYFCFQIVKSSIKFNNQPFFNGKD